MQKKFGLLLIALASLIITSCGCSTTVHYSNSSSGESISESSHASSSGDKSSSSNDSKSSTGTSSQNSSSNTSSQNSSSNTSSSSGNSSSSSAQHIHNYVKNPDTLEYVCSCGQKNGRDFELNVTIPQLHVGDTVSARDYTFSFKNDDGALVFGFVMFWASSQGYFTDKYIPNTMLGENVDAYVFVGVHDATNVKYTDPNNIGDDTKLENCAVYFNGQATTYYRSSILNNIYPDSEPSVIGERFFGYQCGSIGKVLASTSPMVAWPTSDVNAAFQTMGLEPFALPELQDPAITSYEVHVYNNSKAFYIAFFGLKNADANYTVKFYADHLPDLGFTKIENYKYLSPDESFTVYTASTIGASEQILDIELYTKPTYTVTWVGFDGQVVEIDQNVEKGSMPHFDGDLSGYEAKDGYVYYYTGWDKELAPVTGDVTYTAQWYESIFIMDEEYDDGWNVQGLANKNHAGEVTIPAKFFDGRPVKYVAPAAFYECTNVTKLVVPTSIVRIGEEAFDRMISLTELTVPFVGKTKNATGEEGLFSWFFGKQIYPGLDQVAQMYDSSHVIYKQLPTGLTKVNVMDGNLSYGAFYNCRNLETVSLPNTQTIGEQAFAFTTGLKSVQFMQGNDKLERIEAQAFLSSGIPSFIAPTSLKYIGAKAFKNCKSLTSFTAYYAQEDLWIGAYVFDACSALETLALPIYGHVSNLFSTYEFDGSYEMLIGAEMYYMPSSLKNVIVTGGILSVKAFELTNITNVTITTNVIYVNEGALAGMLCLETLSTAFFGTNVEDTTPSDSTVLGYFFGQTKVNSTDYLANQHWNGNTGQVNYYLPETLTSVIFSGSFLSPGAFHNCKKITSIQLTGNITSIGRWTFNNCPAEVTIPSTVVTLDSYAYGQSGIVTAIIPDAVTSLPTTAFSHAEQLETVVIGNGVTSIGDDCFSNCKKLSSVTFGTGALTINDYVFDKCTSLTSITLPAELVRLRGWIFRGCTNLKTVNFAGTKEQWNSVTKHSNWLGNDTSVTVVHCSNGDVTL